MKLCRIYFAKRSSPLHNLFMGLHYYRLEFLSLLLIEPSDLLTYSTKTSELPLENNVLTAPGSSWLS